LSNKTNEHANKERQKVVIGRRAAKSNTKGILSMKCSDNMWRPVVRKLNSKLE